MPHPPTSVIPTEVRSDNDGEWRNLLFFFHRDNSKPGSGNLGQTGIPHFPIDLRHPTPHPPHAFRY